MMSRSGYSDYIDDYWQLIRWRGAVKSAIRGKRGQVFLKEILEALDALPEKRLIADQLVVEGDVCALGAVGKARGLAMSDIDPDDTETVAATFGIANALAAEIVYINDEWGKETPEARFLRVRQWVANQICPVQSAETER